MKEKLTSMLALASVATSTNYAYLDAYEDLGNIKYPNPNSPGYRGKVQLTPKQKKARVKAKKARIVRRKNR
jgi:hypothetical protein